MNQPHGARKDNILQVRLSDLELEIVKQVAQREKLPPSTLGRILLLQRAERYGITERLVNSVDADGSHRETQHE